MPDPYDAVAEQYAELFLDELDRDAAGRRWLARFADLVPPTGGVVADLGCGPGHVTHHLTALGLTVVGYDLSPGQITQARRAFPDGRFRVGDLTDLDMADGSLGGIVSRHSLIHLSPWILPDVFSEWMRVLEPGAPVLVSFFAASSAERHGTAFDHTVATAFELFPATIEQRLRGAGFVDVEVDVGPPPDGARPLDHANVLARRPQT